MAEITKLGEAPKITPTAMHISLKDGHYRILGSNGTQSAPVYFVEAFSGDSLLAHATSLAKSMEKDDYSTEAGIPTGQDLVDQWQERYAHFFPEEV